MKNAERKTGFICAGLLVMATATGAAGFNDGDARYNNMIHPDTYMQQMTDNRTSDALYRNAVTLESFVQQLGDSRGLDTPYRNVINSAAFEEQLGDNFEPTYRNVFSVERFYSVIGDPCLAEGAVEGAIQFARCEAR